MSYEGYTIALCEKGHQWHWDSMEDYCGMTSGQHLCPDCKGPVVWWTDVDETNGVDEETGHCPGYVELEVDKEAVYDHCTCGHGCDRLLEDETYKIPTNVGRTYYEGVALDLGSKRISLQKAAVDKALSLGLDHSELSYFDSVRVPFFPALLSLRSLHPSPLHKGPGVPANTIAVARIPYEVFLTIVDKQQLDNIISLLPESSYSLSWRLTKEEEIQWDKESREP